MADVKLTEIIDVATLQEIQDGFAKLTGMAALTTDADGVAVTKGSNFTDFCMNLTRKSKSGCTRCEQCDKNGGETTLRTRQPTTYFCHAGLVDFAAPIMLNGRMIGSFIGGQVLTETPDESKFRKIAAEINVNPDEYIKALRKVKIVSKEQIDSAAEFLFTLAKVLSNAAYGNYLATQSNAGFTTLNHKMFQKVENAEDVLIESSKRMKKLVTSIDDIVGIAGRTNEEVKSTADTVKVIQDIALNTKILGFNASIEASRSKESGKGFGVIAQEVRGLAETSQSSANKIENTMKQIGSFSVDITKGVTFTRDTVKALIEDLTYFSKLLDEIKHMN